MSKKQREKVEDEVRYHKEFSANGPQQTHHQQQQQQQQLQQHNQHQQLQLGEGGSATSGKDYLF